MARFRRLGVLVVLGLLAAWGGVAPAELPWPMTPQGQAEIQRRRQARLDYVQGQDEFNAGNYQRAAELFARYLKVFPDDPQARRRLERARSLATRRHLGILEVVSQPTAQVWLDGRPVGHTPLRLPAVAAGEHLLEVRAFGASKRLRLQVRPAATLTVRFTLVGGALNVVSRPWAEVWVDGRPVGHSPLVLEGLTVGPVTVTVRRPGYREQTRLVILRRDQRERLSFVLVPR